MSNRANFRGNKDDSTRFIIDSFSLPKWNSNETKVKQARTILDFVKIFGGELVSRRESRYYEYEEMKSQQKLGKEQSL